VILGNTERVDRMCKRILVTGGAGFIGSSLVDALMQSGNHRVTVLDNLSSGHLANLSFWMDNPNFEFVQADLTNLTSITDTVDRCDAVFHLAANPIVKIGTDTRIYYDQNVLSTYNLLDAMKNSKTCKKIIFASTSTVYGESKIMPTPENYAPLQPISIYGGTKLACEAIISGFGHMFDISCVTLRLANIVGQMSSHGIIHDFIIKLKKNPRVLQILGDGKQMKSYLHIDDCISAMMFVLPKVGDWRFETFNVAPSDTINVLDIAKIVIKELGLKEVKLKFVNQFDGRGWKGDVKHYWLDSTKIERFGWKPKYNSSEAVRKACYEHNKLQLVEPK
jgi:UDP-glucose 4-epimerase